MVSNASVFSVLPAEDIARAKSFYVDKLGLKVLFETEGGVALSAGGGTQVFIYPYGRTKGEHTTATFQVADAEAAVRELRGKGIVFEEYDMPGLKTVDGIVEVAGIKGAFFKDSEGNIISVTQVL